MLRRLIILILGTMLVASCHESFNIIYEDVVQKDPNVIPPEEVDIRKVNILPTLSDPLYTIDMPPASEKEDASDKEKVYGKDYATATRGAYGTWEEDKAHWLSTRFHTFALRTGNSMGGAPDYEAAKNGDTSAGVLWDQTMALYDQHGHTQFFDKEGKVVNPKYDIGDNLYRYKFFMLGMDNKPVDFHTEEGKRVVTSVQLDGTHDILHSFAYHDNRQYEEAVNQLPPSDAAKVFLSTGGKENMYNRLSGYLGIHPIFNVNHLLSRFDVYVKGAVTEDTPRGDFLKIIITDVALKAYKNVDIVVADDSWERESYLQQFEQSKIIRPVGEPTHCSMPLYATEFGRNDHTDSYMQGYDFEMLAQEADQLSQEIGEPVIPEGSHWVCTSKRDTLAKSMMMPPLPTEDGQYAVRFKYRYLFTHQDPNTKEYHLGINANRHSPQTIWEECENTILIPKIDTGGYPVVYKGGKRYSLIITVYGKSVIRVEVIQAMKWEDGGDLDIDLESQ
ncbi:MAG: hypothetical protein IKW22_00475 [Bacteroidaceae bacterium]|nr:hypothetical protein [Bacteroidaceae bacterium]